MDLTTILPPHMMRYAHVMALAIASMGWTLPASAQYGTPEEWRRTTPTIQDRDPGIAAPPEAEMDPEYRRQPVFYRTEEKPGTIRRTASSI